jgi:hypothetical protein
MPSLHKDMNWIFRVPHISFHRISWNSIWETRQFSFHYSSLYVSLTDLRERRSCFCVLYYIRGRFSKQATSGSKTVVMDVIGFLCVSLGSSTVQLHDSIGSRRVCACSEVGFSSQNDDRAWGVYYWRAAFCCVFFCEQKDSMQRIFIKKCFLFMLGSVCRVKRFTTVRQTFRWWRGWNGGPEMSKTTVRSLLCCGFRRTGNAVGQVDGGYVEK